MLRFILAGVIAALAGRAMAETPLDAADYVAGTLIVFNDNGAWSWYQDERAIVDPSTDDGNTWSYGGKLFTDMTVGYVNGYVKYASNDRDGIDLITTEHHPRDFNNSVYHGYISGSRIHHSDGTIVDDDIFSAPAPAPTALTKIFAAGTAIGGETLTRCWTIDLAVDDSGNPFGVFTCRPNDEPANSNFNDRRFLYARFDGETWRVHMLAKAGGPAALVDEQKKFSSSSGRAGSRFGNGRG
jgi:hypothetical protein